MEGFVRRHRLYKSKDAEKLVGCDSAVLGSYWTSTTDEEELRTLYPVKLVRFDRARKLQGIGMEQPMMGFRVTGAHAEVSNPENPNTLLWMGMNMLSEYHALFNVLKFYSNMQRVMPIHTVMAMRVLCDQNTEGSSERSFSAHGVYATPLRHALGSKVAANMVKAKENHALVWEAIKDKIWDRYVQKYRTDASAFPDHGQ